MKAGGGQAWWRVPAWAVALVWLAAGCCAFRRAPPAAPPGTAESGPPAPAQPAGPPPAADNSVTNHRRKVVVDTNTVASLQSEQLVAMRRGDDGQVAPAGCAFTRWLDRSHERLYRRLDNAVRRVDTMWLTEDVRPYEYKLSTFKLKPMVKVGGRSKDKDAEYKLKFRADFALSGVKNKLHLFFDNAARNALPGEDPMDQDDTAEVGARALLKTFRDNPLDLGAGVRMHSWEPVAFADIELRAERQFLRGLFRLVPRGSWYSDSGVGQKITGTWTWKFSERRYLQLRAAERRTENSGGWEFEQTVRMAWLRASRTRGWVFQASTFPHFKQSDWYYDDSLVNVTWRGALYRKWIFYTVTPQIEFPKEDEHKAKASIRVGMEILMGGHLDELI